jgi:hypothetical protein
VVQVGASPVIRPGGGANVKQRYMLSGMCGRSTSKLTWKEIVGFTDSLWANAIFITARTANFGPKLFDGV